MKSASPSVTFERSHLQLWCSVVYLLQISGLHRTRELKAFDDFTMAYNVIMTYTPTYMLYFSDT